jgi:hypothetical protein
LSAATNSVRGFAAVLLSSPFRLGSNHCVADPESIVATLLHRFELKRNGGMFCGIHAVKDGRDVVAPINTGYQQEADLIYWTGLKESPVDVAAAFKQQGTNAEVLAQLVDGFGEVD